MRDEAPTPPPDALHELLRSVEASLRDEPTAANRLPSDAIRSALDRVEAATPAGVPLHAQLDAVRRWLRALDEPADHQRFGGVDHLRQHVLLQVRLAQGALEDYEREMTSRPDRE